MLSELRDAIEQLVVRDLPLRGLGLYLHEDLTRFRAITIIQTSLHTSVSTECTCDLIDIGPVAPSGRIGSDSPKCAYLPADNLNALVTG
jgi:hypothetical protein